MKNNIKLIFISLFTFAALSAFTGCSDSEVGDGLEEAADEVKDAAEDVAEETKEVGEEVGDGIKDATN